MNALQWPSVNNRGAGRVREVDKTPVVPTVAGVDIVTDMDRLHAAYTRFAEHADGWSKDPHKYGKVAAVPNEGEPAFFDTIELAMAAMTERGLLGRVHLALVYPFTEGRRQVTWARYASNGRSGFVLRLRVRRATLAIPPNGPDPPWYSEVPFVVDTGAELTRLPGDLLDQVEAPVIGVVKGLDASGRQTLDPLRLVAISNGSSALYLDPWAVSQGPPDSVGLLGRDALSRCRFQYPVEGRLELAFLSTT